MAERHRHGRRTQVVVAVLVTATVLLPPRVKLIMFDGHRYNRADAKGADGKAAEVVLTLAPLLHKYPQQHGWLVLGLDAHVCKVLLTMQVSSLWSLYGAHTARDKLHYGPTHHHKALASTACDAQQHLLRQDGAAACASLPMSEEYHP